MQNQQKYELELNNCRKEIDEIDDNILELLKKRINIVKKVKEIKEDNGDEFFIKSAREADMINDLIKKSDGLVSDETIISIWRKVITSSNMLEQPIKISAYNPSNKEEYRYIAREYYSKSVPVTFHNSAQKVISDLENDNAEIALFEIPDDQNDSNWWINLANNQSGIKIFAKLPFTHDENGPNLLALAKKEQEKSRNDVSLLCVELSDDYSSANLLSEVEKIGLKARIIKKAKLSTVNGVSFYLAEIESYIDDDSDELKSLKTSKIKPFIKVLGNFAKN